VSETDAPDILGHCSDLTASSPWSNAAVAQVGRRTLLGGLASLASLPALAAARTSAPEGFVAIGDWGRKGEPVQRAVALSMGEAAREVRSRFVISSGDNFYPGGVTSVADPHWRQSFEDVYVDPSLQTTWYASLGNHDYRGVPQAQVDYSRHSRRWRMPAPYYRVPGSILGVPSLDLFVMDTSPFVDDLSIDERVQQLCRGHWWEQETQPQIAWLKAALARSRAPWKIVVGHHPIYSGAHGDSPVLIARVAPILEAFAVQAYINGHDHDLQHVRRGRVDYICTGAGAEASNVRKVAGTRFCVGRPGFAAFRLGEDALDLQFRAADGQILRISAAVGARWATPHPVDGAQESATRISQVDRFLKAALGGRGAAHFTDKGAEGDERIHSRSAARLRQLADTAFLGTCVGDQLGSQKAVQLADFRTDLITARGLGQGVRVLARPDEGIWNVDANQSGVSDGLSENVAGRVLDVMQPGFCWPVRRSAVQGPGQRRVCQHHRCRDHCRCGACETYGRSHPAISDPRRF
jgi:acid phosphatase